MEPVMLLRTGWVTLLMSLRRAMAQNHRQGRFFLEGNKAEKIKFGPQTLFYPAVSLIGANVDGKPNFMTVSYCGSRDLLRLRHEVPPPRRHHGSGLCNWTRASG